MVFTSFIYYLFFPTVFGLYWFVFQRNFKAQNVLLLVASYFFYGWWDWRFLSLVAFSTVLDYTMGRLIGAQEDDRKRRWLLWISLGINLAFLGFFKYYNFFVTSWVDAWASVGIHMPDAQYHALDTSRLRDYLNGLPIARERLGGTAQAWTIREVGDGNLNLVFIIEGSAGGLVVKQASLTINAQWMAFG